MKLALKFASAVKKNVGLALSLFLAGCCHVRDTGLNEGMFTAVQTTQVAVPGASVVWLDSRRQGQIESYELVLPAPDRISSNPWRFVRGVVFTKQQLEEAPLTESTKRFLLVDAQTIDGFDPRNPVHRIQHARFRLNGVQYFQLITAELNWLMVQGGNNGEIFRVADDDIRKIRTM